MNKIVLLLLIATVTQAFSQSDLPNTDIYLVNFQLKDTTLTVNAVTPVSNGKTYENQPFFSFDGINILYSSVQEGVNPDIYMYSTQSNTAYSFYESYNEGEFWPQYTPDGLGYSLVIKSADGTQKIWKNFNDARTPVCITPKFNDVGNYCWIGDDYIAFRRETKESLLLVMNIKTGETKTIADKVGTSLAKVPGEKAFYYLKHQENEDLLMKYNVEDGSSTQIIKSFRGLQDFATTVYGDVWVVYQGSIYAYMNGQNRWIKIHTFTNDILRKAYRIAINRAMNQMAVVVKN